MSEQQNRFTSLHRERLENSNDSVEVIKDLRTGVCYLHIFGGMGAAAITPMLDAGGKPVTDFDGTSATEYRVTLD